MNHLSVVFVVAVVASLELVSVLLFFNSALTVTSFFKEIPSGKLTDNLISTVPDDLYVDKSALTLILDVSIVVYFYFYAK